MKACFVSGITTAGEFVSLYAGLDANAAMDTFTKLRSARGITAEGKEFASVALFIRPPTAKRAKFAPVAVAEAEAPAEDKKKASPKPPKPKPKAKAKDGPKPFDEEGGEE